jgi:hypothetical protein
VSGAVVVYALYVLLALSLVTWLAIVLRRDGRVFLDDVFRSQTQLAASVSQLLVTGYLVFTMGYALLLLRIDSAASTVGALRSAARQFGFLLLSLGAMHSLNMMILLAVRRRSAERGPSRRRRVTAR